MEDLYYIVGFFILIIVFFWFKQSKKEKDIKKIFLEQENFNPSLEYISNFNHSAIAVDSENKKILFLQDMKISIINYNELLSVETRINDEVLYETKRGSQLVGAAVGGLLLGPLGLLLGGLTGKKSSTKKISKLSIRATISNIKQPFCDIIFYEGSPVKTDSFAIEGHSKQADEWIGRLSVIISLKK
jgi:hypothetical protein